MSVPKKNTWRHNVNLDTANANYYVNALEHKMDAPRIIGWLCYIPLAVRLFRLTVKGISLVKLSYAANLNVSLSFWSCVKDIPLYWLYFNYHIECVVGVVFDDSKAICVGCCFYYDYFEELTKVNVLAFVIVVAVDLVASPYAFCSLLSLFPSLESSAITMYPRKLVLYSTYDLGPVVIVTVIVTAAFFRPPAALCFFHPIERSPLTFIRWPAGQMISPRRSNEGRNPSKGYRCRWNWQPSSPLLLSCSA